jgi:hypothetical protein
VWGLGKKLYQVGRLKRSKPTYVGMDCEERIMKKVLVAMLCLSMSYCFANSLHSLSYRNLKTIMNDKEVTPLVSRIESKALREEHISFLYYDDHTFLMRVNQKDKIKGTWHIAPNGKLCRYFNEARRTVICDHWYDLGREYLVLSTDNELRSLVPKESIRPLLTVH